MRVAYVSMDPGVPVFGRKGSSVHVQAVLRGLVRAGAEVHLLTTRPGTDVPHDLARVVVHRIPVRTSADDADRERALIEADARSSAVLDRLPGPIDLVYERYSLWGTTATRWARRHEAPSLLEVNAPLITEQRQHRVLVDEATAEGGARAAIGAATAVIAVSAPVAAWARRRAADPGRVHVLANGVDTTRITPGNGRPAGRPLTVGFVGTLKPWHGLSHLLAAFAQAGTQVPGLRLLVVGDGPQAAEFDADAARLAVADRIERTGALAPAEVPAALHRMDIAVAPYPACADFYFSPLKVYEYLAAGLATVASAVGELPATLDHGRLGVLVPPGDPPALAAAIVRLAADDALRATFGRRARRAAVARHDWTVAMTRALALVGLRPDRAELG